MSYVFLKAIIINYLFCVYYDAVSNNIFAVIRDTQNVLYHRSLMCVCVVCVCVIRVCVCVCVSCVCVLYLRVSVYMCLLCLCVCCRCIPLCFVLLHACV